MPHFRAFSVCTNILLDAEKNIKQIKDLNTGDNQETFTYLTGFVKLTILNTYNLLFSIFSCIFAKNENNDEYKIRKSIKFI